MRKTFSQALLTAALFVAAISPAFSQQPSFADLLTRAQTQAAAGHRFSPAGDNMTETVAGMMDIIGTATPQQLADLSDLLQRTSDSPAPPPAQTASARAFAAPAIQEETALAPVLPAPIPPPQIAPATPAPPRATSILPAAPQINGSQATPGRTTEGRTTPDQTSPNQTTPAQATPGLAPSPGAQASLTPDLRPTVTQSTLFERPLASRPRMAAPPSARAAELYARGRDAERQGNVSGARRFFASAADQGSAAAARSLGRLYDPDYLGQTALGGIAADPELARHWYERAIAMGDAEAGPLLDALAVR
jgi:TPR repeat protein